MPLPHQHASAPDDPEDKSATSDAPATTTRRPNGWTWWIRCTLFVYWLALFASTHLPPPPPVLSVDNLDKLMHLVAYAGLAFLLVVVYAGRRPVTAIQYAQLLAVVAIYGIVDEVLQTFVGRTCDFWDWAADVIGAAVGLTAFHLLTYRRRQAKTRN